LGELVVGTVGYQSGGDGTGDGQPLPLLTELGMGQLLLGDELAVGLGMTVIVLEAH
jgi:hypothetical protein